MLNSMRMEKHRKTAYISKQKKPSRLSSFHLFRCTQRTWEGKKGSIKSSNDFKHRKSTRNCFRHTVRNTDASSSPTEKMRPLLFRWIWAEKRFKMSELMQIEILGKSFQTKTVYITKTGKPFPMLKTLNMWDQFGSEVDKHAHKALTDQHFHFPLLLPLIQELHII